MVHYLGLQSRKLDLCALPECGPAFEESELAGVRTLKTLLTGLWVGVVVGSPGREALQSRDLIYGTGGGGI